MDFIVEDITNNKNLIEVRSMLYKENPCSKCNGYCFIAHCSETGQYIDGYVDIEPIKMKFYEVVME